MIVQRPGNSHYLSRAGRNSNDAANYFQLQLGMKFSPDWVS
jgi:glycyl-tRNA synthetase alpha subunit